MSSFIIISLLLFPFSFSSFLIPFKILLIEEFLLRAESNEFIFLFELINISLGIGNNKGKLRVLFG